MSTAELTLLTMWLNSGKWLIRKILNTEIQACYGPYHGLNLLNHAIKCRGSLIPNHCLLEIHLWRSISQCLSATITQSSTKTLYETLQRLGQNLITVSLKTPHTSPSRASHGVSFVRIWEKIDCIISWFPLQGYMAEAVGRLSAQKHGLSQSDDSISRSASEVSVTSSDPSTPQQTHQPYVVFSMIM